MVYTPEAFATFYFERFKRRAPVAAALLKRPNHGYTVEALNDFLGLDSDKQTIEGTRRVLRDIEELLEIHSMKKERGPPEKIYKPGKLLDSYRDPILSMVLGKERAEELDIRIRCAIRCREDPMECPRSDCRICAKKTL